MLNKWLKFLNPNDHAIMRLYCFPYAGGSASIYRSWVNLLSPDIEICAIQLPGREERLAEPVFNQMGPLINEIAEMVGPHIHTPFALFGHSLGAMLSFELARRLHELGLPTPSHLFVSGHRAPHLPDESPLLHLYPDEDLVIELSRLQGAPADILSNREMMDLFLPFIRADLELAETYRFYPTAQLSCPISAFGGLSDTEVTSEHLAGWQYHTTAQFKLHMLPGNHFFLHSAQHTLLELIYRDCQPIIEKLTENLPKTTHTP